MYNYYYHAYLKVDGTIKNIIRMNLLLIELNIIIIILLTVVIVVIDTCDIVTLPVMKKKSCFILNVLINILKKYNNI